MGLALPVDQEHFEAWISLQCSMTPMDALSVPGHGPAWGNVKISLSSAFLPLGRIRLVEPIYSSLPLPLLLSMANEYA